LDLSLVVGNVGIACSKRAAGACEAKEQREYSMSSMGRHGIPRFQMVKYRRRNYERDGA